jgi:hypothetical protein
MKINYVPSAGIDVIHVLPIDDLKEHSENSTECECEPSLQFSGNSAIITHNAYDGRE